VQSPLIQNNSIYKCCTILNGIIQQCQQFLAYTELTAVVATKKQQTILTDTSTSSSSSSSSSSISTSILTSSSSTATTTVITSTLSLTSYTIPTISDIVSTDQTTVEFKFSQVSIEKGIKIIENNENKKVLVNMASSTKISINSVTSNSNSTVNMKEMSDAEIGIIIACTGGIVVIAFLFILGMLCYKRHRYGAIYLSKSSIGWLNSILFLIDLFLFIIMFIFSKKKFNFFF